MIIIPARLESSRLANKLLLPLGEIPIIVHVANIAKEIDSCVVACDSKEIAEVCKAYKIECVMTSKTHQSGTDRCAEAARILGLSDNEIVINLQGDEPFIESSVITALRNAMQTNLNNNGGAFMASCAKSISDDEADDPNLVKVVLDRESYALYFSRSKIPFNRDGLDLAESFRESSGYLGHLGIYAFSNASLQEFCSLSKAPLESIEKLEQLRALWHRKQILMVKVQSKSIGIDTLSDYNAALKLIKEKI